MSALPSLLSLGAMPRTFREFCQGLHFANLDVLSLMPMSCWSHQLGRFKWKLVLTIVSPLVLLLGIIVAHVVSVRILKQDKSASFSVASQRACLLAYLLLPSVTSVVFAAFNCDYNFGIDGESYLMADYSTSCTSDEYRSFILPLAITGVLIYPVFVNLLYIILLVKERALIHERDPSVVHLAFLTSAYSGERFFWEPIDSIRRCALTGGLFVLTPIPDRRVGMGLRLSLAFQVLYHFADPYLSSEDAQIASLANAEITFTFVMLSLNQVCLWECVCQRPRLNSPHDARPPSPATRPRAFGASL